MKSVKGLSLIELMVAMTLGLIVTATILQMFVGSRQALNVTYDLGATQQIGRVAMGELSRSIHMAGGWGLTSGDVVKDNLHNLAVSLPVGCDQSWLFATDIGLQGYDGDITLAHTDLAPNQQACLGNTQYVPNSDILVVRYADQTRLKAKAALAGNYGYFLRLTDGEIYLSTGADIATKTDVGVAYNLPYQFEIYYLRACAFLDAAGNCADAIPSLIRRRLIDNQLQDELLVQGVAQMQFEYGVDDALPDFTLDAYHATAADVNNWQKLMLVRTALLVQGMQADSNVDEQGTSYVLVGDMGASPYVVPASAAHYRHQLFLQDINARNVSLQNFN
jgi:type IV pilus assembly protein PilW